MAHQDEGSGGVAIGTRSSETKTQKRKVNDFTIQIATVNGSGSQSANSVLLRTIFRMGIPVSGKNLFPSNIAGLPTWYTIRASKDGYLARTKEIDIVVAMNAETAQADIISLPAGGMAIYEESANLQQYRNGDVDCFPVPFDKLTAAVCPEAKLRKLVKNMVYVGVIAYLVDMDMAAVEAALRQQFAKKVKAADLNWSAVRTGYEYAESTLARKSAFKLETLNKTEGKIIIDGNSAAAMGCLFAGCTVVPWYPITPSSSLVESFIELAKKYRLEDGKATFAIMQAEDELAAIGAVLGAGWAGARAMTASSGPGISLMAEFAGLGYYAELPGVIFDVQRTGPSTGMPTRTQQGDLLSVAFLSHGDTKHPMLLPGSVKECYEMAVDAFDLAERLQTPVFVMSDLDLGMNNWMSEPFTYPEKPIDRGKVLSKEDLERLGGFARYKDVDGDGIGWRTLPGTDHPLAAYFTRGSGHNEKAQYTERPDDYTVGMERLAKKFETARSLMPRPEVVQTGKSKIGVIAFGTSDFGVRESRDQLRKEYALETDYLRLRAFPFAREVHEFVASHERVYVVEQNRDAQMLSLLKLDIESKYAAKLRSVRHFNGLPLDARSVTDEIVTQEGI
jgi:2-oxoglutarate ferredoxin oxidoreductase subunit alpha